VCAERKPKGLIFLGGNLKYFREGFSAIKVPCVLTSLSGEELGFDNLSSFTTDDKEGAKDAIGYLVKYGHRHIGVIGGSLDREQGQISDYRLSGAMEVISREGLDFTLEKNYEPCMFSMEGGYEAAQKLIRRNKEITAIFALGDMIALGAVRGITDLGKKIPDDISIIGYDGIGYTQFSIPRIATIRQDIDVLAKRGVEDLLLRIHCKYEPVHELIPFTFVEGESVSEYHG
jgi:LacI family transcriptional regulator